MPSQGIEVAARLCDDLGVRHFAHVGVRPAGHARFLDPRKFIDALLDLFGEELQPGDQDEGFLAALQVQRAGAVQEPEVAGEEPPVHRDLLGSRQGE